ncbi:MAG: (deoxy)nucleoside triphosphate pyrophosphohydrolase [Epulopiscium sp.]|nr:(deoxy)nucleoside triphosphate pyrophosphohydrolase [Candidatus Epulonipiscium sp.]
MKKTIKVVGAIIENDQEEILCALRSTKMNLSNYWEFPGGKVETSETIAQTIEREIDEELDCTVKFLELYGENIHEYDNFIIHLYVTKCKLIESTPKAKEHAALLWLKRKNLFSLNWAPADVPIIEKLIAES